ncbi:exostosin family protein [Sphingobacterium corticibacterium]|uniref:exostosin family protein n=1 Tax=Sphingobacterium corticibacterium TaxID=2484746 RepID=UPI0013EE7D08|nr:exostosin family protein [Sphingobacterium corticibacterium]
MKQPCRCYNYFPIDATKVQDTWLMDFVRHYHVVPDGSKLNFISVFGNKEIIHFVKRPRVFYTGENIHTDIVSKARFQYSHDYMAKCDLSIGFDYQVSFTNTSYIRLPIWVFYIIPFDADYAGIKAIIDRLNDPSTRRGNRDKFTAHIARHDNNGIRRKIITALQDIDHVDCAGMFMNNTNDLFEKFGDDKLIYLSTFKFNICPENSDTTGYTTEKVFESIQAGCIPVYWGSDNNPEPDILNPEAIILFDERNPKNTQAKIKELYDNPKVYEEFIQIPPFKENAAEVIWTWIEQLKREMKQLYKIGG